MLVSIIVTLLVVPAVLLSLLAVLATAGYTAPVPGGADAMGLALPFFTTAGAGLAMVVASWVSVGAGRLDWISPRPMIPFTVATLASLGVALASVGVLVAWMEKMGAWVPSAGLICGALGPICLGATLIGSAWLDADRIKDSALPIVAGLPLTLVAFAGFGAGLYALTAWMKLSGENTQRLIAEAKAEETEFARRAALSPAEALREDFAHMSPEAPLWVIVARLPDEHDAEARTLIVERALRVPNFDSELEKTISADWERYRHACVELIRLVPDEMIRPAWSSSLSRAITISADEIEKNHQWFTPREDRNPDPIGHVRAMADAAARLGNPPELSAALDALSKAIDRASIPEREQALTAMHAGADRASEEK